METLVKILPADLVGKLHTGQSDSPELGTVGMQQLFDAHPKLIDEKFNSAVDAQNANNTKTQAHIDSTDNPHGVTKEHVGLSKCDNTADADKPVSTAQGTAIAAVQAGVDNLKANVLTKDNTIPFTPTGDYQPATKKFVTETFNEKGNVTQEQVELINQIPTIQSAFTALDATKANKSTAATVILTAAGWADNQQTISVDGATATNIIEIAVDKTATLEQEAAFYAAALKDGGQTDGTITLNVSGKVPTMDIPILVIARGDL